MSGGMKITFHGVRGSTPCDAPHLARFGGNTSCVLIEAEDQPPIIFDLGTGLRSYGVSLRDTGRAAGFRGSVLLSHLHWDHVQGLPFFEPLHERTSVLDVYGPRQSDGPLTEVFAGLMRPSYFPIRPDGLAGAIAFYDAGDDDFPLGTAKVRSRWIRYVGPTLGYRVEWNGVSVAYLSDHGQGCVTGDTDDYVSHDVFDLCDGVDLLIHDAQHTAGEFEAKRHWGHCTVEYALHVARESGAQRLALFHHDPFRDDAAMEVIERDACDSAERKGLREVFAAFEGMVVELEDARHAGAV
ncbi:MAG: MBL fold metallo-hydrolase [Actinobacteria bacterium]|nr:MBL fold metallo-hydrolase [Actinomycetota bacterium]